MVIILSVLLAINITALVCVLIYRSVTQDQAAEVTVPNNIISPYADGATSATYQDDKTEGSAGGDGAARSVGSTRGGISAHETDNAAGDGTQQVISSEERKKAAVISLYRNHAEDNQPFQTSNMFPGDVETKYYCVKISHSGDVIVCYRADVRPGYEKLSEALRCRIVLMTTGKTLYDGLMKDMPQSLNYGIKADAETQSELYYAVTVYLDTGAGNEYQNKELAADFRWWVKDTGNLEPIPTGDNSHIFLWIGISSVALFIILFLVKKRRKEEGENDR